MREKSSSVFTSRSSRRALRCATSCRSRCTGGNGVAGISQTVFERPDEQRQRRPELVTDVAEERRLRPIELRQRFGALSLLLVRARVGERRAQLVGDEIQERAVLIVEWAPRIEADDQSAGLARPGSTNAMASSLTSSGLAAASCSSRSRRAALEFVTEIREREQDVLRLRGERLGGQDAGVARRARGGIALGETPSTTPDAARRRRAQSFR